MNTLVVYDSKFGNTEKIARRIAATLSEFGEAKALRATEVPPGALAKIDLLIVGCPTQGWTSTPAVKTFLAGLDRPSLTQLRFAEFDTRFDKPQIITGSGARSLEKQLQRLGATMIVDPESFLVRGTEGPLAEGELERAAQWARKLYDEYQSEPQVLAT
jgi:flavodoxin